MIKRILAVAIGILVTAFSLGLIEYINTTIHPTDFDLTDPARIELFVQQLPISAKILLIFGWVFSAFMGGIIGGVISPITWKKTASIIGIIFTIGTIFNFYAIPHPYWVIFIGVITYIPFTYIGAKKGSSWLNK